MVVFTDDFKRRMRSIVDTDSYRSSSTHSTMVRQMDNYLAQAFTPGDSTRWYVDETGPNPYTYFLSSIGFELCNVVAEHCASLGLELDRLQITLDMTTSNHSRANVSSMKVRIVADGGGGRLVSVIQESLRHCALLGSVSCPGFTTVEARVNGEEKAFTLQ